MTTSPQRPPYDALVVALIELRAALYDLERRRSERQCHYRRLGREADALIDNALEGIDHRETATRFDGNRMRYTAPPRPPGDPAPCRHGREGNLCLSLSNA